MEHAGRRIRAPSPRANGRLAYGSHGARRKGESERRAPERMVGSLATFMGYARTGFLAPSPRSIGRLACSPHGACQGIGDFHSIFERIIRRTVTCKKDNTVSG